MPLGMKQTHILSINTDVINKPLFQITKKICKGFGSDLVVFDSNSSSGYYMSGIFLEGDELDGSFLGGYVLINSNIKNPIIETLQHEILDYIEKAEPEPYLSILTTLIESPAKSLEIYSKKKQKELLDFYKTNKIPKMLNFTCQFF